MGDKMNEQIELADYFWMIRKNIILSAGIFIIILGCVALYTFTAPKTYEALSQIMVTSQDQTSMLLEAAPSRIDIETEKQIIMSASVMDAVYAKFPDNFEFKVDSVKNSNVIEIKVESKDPLIAAQIAQTIAESYIDYSRKTKQELALNINQFISEQIDQYKKELDTLSTSMLIYKNKKDLLPSEEIKFQSLKQNSDAKEKLYTYLLSRREEVGIAAQERSGNARIIEYAAVPLNPIRPNIPLNLALGLVLGAVLTVGIVFIKESNGFRDSKDVESELGITVMGILPKRKKKYQNMPKLIDLFKSPKFFFSDLTMLFKRRKLPNLDYYTINPTSAFADAIHILRTNLMFSIRDTGLVSVTSPEDREGKSVTSANLAISISSIGKKVLLIDANLRNPTLGMVFGLKENMTGLSEMILHNTKPEDAIRKTKYKGLHFLPAGKSAGSHTDIFSSEKAKHVFEMLKRGGWDVILIDGPSLTHPEGIMLAANSHYTLLVTGQSKARNIAIKAKETLTKVKAHLAGIVINTAR